MNIAQIKYVLHKTSFFLKTHSGFSLTKFQMLIQLLSFLLHGMVQGAEVNRNRQFIDLDKDREIVYKLVQWAKRTDLGKTQFNLLAIKIDLGDEK